jgi:hypothetical protein
MGVNLCMTAFCTHCGAALSADPRFCTECGTVVAPTVKTDAPIAPLTQNSPGPKKSRRWRWVLAVIVFFALGFFLGRLLAPKCPSCPSTAAAGTGGGGAVPATGSGRPLRPDNAAASAGGKGEPGDADAGGGNSESEIPDGAGKLSPHDLGGEELEGDAGHHRPDVEDPTPDLKQHSEPGDPELDGSVAQLAAGQTLGPDVDPTGTTTPTSRTKSWVAHDFRYDKTELPRYPTDVRGVASSISYAVNPQTGDRTGGYGTGAGIVTSSSFEDVVAWYRKNMPPGWQSTTIGDFGRLAQQAKQNDIMRLLKGESGDAPASADAAATPPTPKVRLSLFKPQSGPANSSVMIIQRDDKAVTAFLQARFK